MLSPTQGTDEVDDDKFRHSIAWDLCTDLGEQAPSRSPTKLKAGGLTYLQPQRSTNKLSPTHHIPHPIRNSSLESRVSERSVSEESETFSQVSTARE
jgi:hypothetical protein